MGAIQAQLGFVQENMLSSVIQRMSEGPIPLAHWTGYTVIVLVASACIRKWTVTIFDSQEDEPDRKSTRLNSSHSGEARMPSSA